MRKTPERVEILAAEYVLGSLKGLARRRFERWMMESYQVRQEVWFWEEKLSGLASSVETEQPPSRVWGAIENRLWPSPSRRPAWLWPSWSLLATAAAVIMAVLLIQGPETQPDPYPTLSGAIVQQDVSDPLWLISDGASDQRLRLKPVAAQAPEPDKDYELWVVPGGERTPLSLGVISAGDSTLEVELDEELRAALLESRTLAVSLEPLGGSPTGAPTGPILHVAKLHEL